MTDEGSAGGTKMCSVTHYIQVILETCVSFGEGVSLNRMSEDSDVFSRVLHDEAGRPTRQWVFNTLKLRYEYVYATRT